MCVCVCVLCVYLRTCTCGICVCVAAASHKVVDSMYYRYNVSTRLLVGGNMTPQILQDQYKVVPGL